jgi:hypothetical protein
MSRLLRVLYASRWSNVLGDDAEAALHRIVATSIGNNRLASITGLLVTHEGWFLQALEGPETGVRALMDRIARDPRHRGVRVLDQAPCECRLFQDWNMAGARLSPDADPLLVELGQIARFDGYALDAKGALHLLVFAAEARRRREREGLGLGTQRAG